MASEDDKFAKILSDPSGKEVILLNTIVHSLVETDENVEEFVGLDFVDDSEEEVEEQREVYVESVSEFVPFEDAPFVYLSEELLLRIFSFAQPADLLRAEQVSKTWQRVANDNKLWFLNYCVLRGKTGKVDLSTKWKVLRREVPQMETNWKKLYWTVRRTKEAARLREFAELFRSSKVPTFIEEEEDINWDDIHNFVCADESIRLERKNKMESLQQDGSRRRFLADHKQLWQQILSGRYYAPLFQIGIQIQPYIYSKATQYYWKNKKKKGKPIYTAARSIRSLCLSLDQTEQVDDDVFSGNEDDNPFPFGPIVLVGFGLQFPQVPLVQEVVDDAEEDENEEETKEIKTSIQDFDITIGIFSKFSRIALEPLHTIHVASNKAQKIIYQHEQYEIDGQLEDEQVTSQPRPLDRFIIEIKDNCLEVLSLKVSLDNRLWASGLEQLQNVQSMLHFGIEYTECKLDNVKYILEKLQQKGFNFHDNYEKMTDISKALNEFEGEDWRNFVHSIDKMPEQRKQWTISFLAILIATVQNSSRVLTLWPKVKRSLLANPLNTQIFFYARQLDKFHRGRNEKAFKMLDKHVTEGWFDSFLLYSSEECTDVEDWLYDWFYSILVYFMEPKRLEWEKELKMYIQLQSELEETIGYMQ